MHLFRLNTRGGHYRRRGIECQMPSRYEFKAEEVPDDIQLWTFVGCKRTTQQRWG